MTGRGARVKGVRKSGHAGGHGRGQVSQETAAKMLGVSREHLNRVLNGHRESRSLMRRWRELVGEAVWREWRNEQARRGREVS